MESKELWDALWKMDKTGERMPWHDSELDMYHELRTDLDNLMEEMKAVRAEIRKHRHLEGQVVIPL